MNYEQKYLKYKNKYIELRKQIGGWKCTHCNTENEEPRTWCKHCERTHVPPSAAAPSAAAPSAAAPSAAAPSGVASSGTVPGSAVPGNAASGSAAPGSAAQGSAAPIKIYNCVVGTCYRHKSNNRYLGKFLRKDGRARDSRAGEAGNTMAPIYVFDNETIEDNYPADMVIETKCL